MRRIFVSVGTSLLTARRDFLGARRLARSLVQPGVMEAWWQDDEQWRAAGGREIATELISSRLESVTRSLLDAGDKDSAKALSALLSSLDQYVAPLREALHVAEQDAGPDLWSAEMSSLVHLSRRRVLRDGDRIILLASDDPQGALVGLALQRILCRHDVLLSCDIEVVWPRHWQPQDVVRLTESGAANLLAAVNSRLMDLPQPSRPFFVSTGGLKLGIAVLTQVASWQQVNDHDGMFIKTDDPGGWCFPPFAFEAPGRTEDQSAGRPGWILLPRMPADESLSIPEQRIEGLRRAIASHHRHQERRMPITAARTSLIVTCGTGLVEQRPLLVPRFGVTRMANPGLWTALHRGNWESLEAARAAPAGWPELPMNDQDPTLVPAGWPSDEAILGGTTSVLEQIAGAWSGDGKDLPAELALLHSLRRRPGSIGTGRWIFDNLRRIVILSTDSFVGELCASWVAQFLRSLDPGCDVLEMKIDGLHPYGWDPSEDPSAQLTRIVGAERPEYADRVMIAPMGGSKLHVPWLTALASTVSAPLLMGHTQLRTPIIVPWLEAPGGQVRPAALSDWPELEGFPVLNLEGSVA